MKKYIYLILGLILIITLPSAIPLLKPPIDDEAKGFNFGLIFIHLLGLVFVFLYFRALRKDRKNNLK